MANIILKGEGFAGIADEKRRAIKEAMAAADAMGVLPDDPEKRKLVIDRLDKRLSRKGWNWQKDGTVVRVDDRGVARVIPQSEGVGFLPGTLGGRQRESGEVTWTDIPALPKPDARAAANRFHARIVDALEKTGRIPVALQRELEAEGWKLGQPVPRQKLEDWCNSFQAEFWRKHPRADRSI